jgi:hypothetical protein
VLRAIEYENSAVHGECGNDIGILGLIACFVDFARVVDLLHNVEIERLFGTSVAANLSSLFVELCQVGHTIVGNLDMGDLNVILRLARRVRSKKYTVGVQVCPFDSAYR